MGYNPCFKCDKKDILCSMRELNYHRNKQIVDEESKQPHCKYCFNARVYKPTDEKLMDPFSTELTDENDSSSCSVGTSYNNTRLMITSGHGEPVRIEIDKFFEDYQEWHTVGRYYPKYCPECGRRLDEYENHNNND